MTTSLHDRSILFVDDTQYVLDSFLPSLQALTGESASGLLHHDQSEEQLIEQIFNHKPQILLLDGNLANGLKGYHLLPKLLQKDSSILCIGFSSAESLRSTFLQAGAKGFVYKDPSTVEECLQQLEEVVDALRREG